MADTTKDKLDGAPISFLFTTTANNIAGIDANISNALNDNNPNAVLGNGTFSQRIRRPRCRQTWIL
ncbi:MAG TPA: hypothetical protein VGK30_17455 [Candidatus Binatia bacterium]